MTVSCTGDLLEHDPMHSEYTRHACPPLLAIGLAFLLMLVACGDREDPLSRDFVSEYFAMTAERYPTGRDGLPAYEAIVEHGFLDEIREIGESAALEVDAAWTAAGRDTASVDLGAIPWAAVTRDRVYKPSLEEDHPDGVAMHHPDALRLGQEMLEAARAIAIPRVLEVLSREEVRELFAEFARHDVITPPIDRQATIFELKLNHCFYGRRLAGYAELCFRDEADESVRLAMLQMGLAAARVAGTTPHPIGLLVQNAIEIDITAMVLDLLAEDADWPQDPGTYISAIQAHSGLRPELRWVMQGERLSMLDTLAVQYKPGGGTYYLGLGFDRPGGIPHAQMIIIIDQFYDHLDRFISLRPTQRSTATGKDDPETYLDSLDTLAAAFFEILLPNYGAVFNKRLEADAALAGTIVALAIRAYQHDHDGRSPASLEDLVPCYIAELPEDPFAEAPGTPLVYRARDDGGALLYARGLNFMDNQGIHHAKSLDRRSEADIIFLPRPR